MFFVLIIGLTSRYIEYKITIGDPSFPGMTSFGNKIEL